MDSAISSEWAALVALCMPIEELKKKHGVEFHSPSPDQIRLTSGDCAMVITRGHDEISAVMRQPNGTVLERKFTLQSEIEYSVLVEGGGSNPKLVSEVFKELMAWFHSVACSPQ